MKNIHILPTDKPSRLIQAEDDELMLLNELYENTHNINKHIYITSDEEIKNRDWYIADNKVYRASVDHMPELYTYSCKKIILTTDDQLIKDGVQDIDNEFLEWFVKNPSCEYVKVEKEHHAEIEEVSYEGDFQNVDYIKYKVIIPKEEPKQEITIEEIEQQITLTEARGERVIKYLDKYKGQSIYNEIALAIEFGYQLKLEEDEQTRNT